MNKKPLIALTLVAALSGMALADGFSATLEVPVSPAFGINGSLNLNVESPTGLVTGGSLIGSYSGGPFNLGLRLGTKYAVDFYRDFRTDLEGYIGLAGNVFFLPSPISLGADVSAGFRLRHRLSGLARLYSDLDVVGSYSFANASFSPLVGGTLGLKLDSIPNTDIYLQGALGTRFNNLVGYDLRAAAYLDVTPEVKLGGSVGFGTMDYAPNGHPAFTTIGTNAAVSLRLGLQFTQNPNTIGTPGSYLP